MLTAGADSYTRIYPEFLFNSLNSIKRHGWQDPIELQIRPYDVRHKMEYPDQGQLGGGLWDALMITGSGASCSPLRCCSVLVLTRAVVG